MRNSTIGLELVLLAAFLTTKHVITRADILDKVIWRDAEGPMANSSWPDAREGELTKDEAFAPLPGDGEQLKDRSVSMKCGGHCCRRYALPFSPDELAAAGADETSTLMDIKQIAEMSIFLEIEDGGHKYTCKNLTSDGLCGIYDDRPRMCSQYPYGRSCAFPQCEAKEVADGAR